MQLVVLPWLLQCISTRVCLYMCLCTEWVSGADPCTCTVVAGFYPRLVGVPVHFTESVRAVALIA